MGDAKAGGIGGAFKAPRLRDWAESAGLLLVFLGLAALLGLVPEAPAAVDFRALAVTALIAIVLPALGEELVFRVALQPRPGAGLTSRSLARIALSLALFVLWHPVQVWLGLPFAQEQFLDPAFLAAAGLLGLACTVSYQRSGSIWPAVALHWLVVVGWKAASH